MTYAPQTRQTIAPKDRIAAALDDLDATLGAYVDAQIAALSATLTAQLNLGGVPSDVVAPFDPRLFGSALAYTAVNQARGVRVVCRKSGQLRDLTIAVGTASGNIDVGVYDTGNTTTGVRTKKASSGSIACPAAAANPLVVTYDPNIAVTAGQQLEFELACDNTTATFYRFAAQSPIVQLPDAFWAVPGGVKPKLINTVSSAFPLPATVAEASWATGQTAPFIIARIA